MRRLCWFCICLTDPTPARLMVFGSGYLRTRHELWVNYLWLHLLLFLGLLHCANLGYFALGAIMKICWHYQPVDTVLIVERALEEAEQHTEVVLHVLYVIEQDELSAVSKRLDFGNHHSTGYLRVYMLSIIVLRCNVLRKSAKWQIQKYHLVVQESSNFQKGHRLCWKPDGCNLLDERRSPIYQ